MSAGQPVNLSTGRQAEPTGRRIRAATAGTVGRVSSPSESRELTGLPEAADQPAGVNPVVSIACPSCRRLVAADGPCSHCGHQPLAPAAAPAEPTAVLPPVPERTAELDVIPSDDPP